MSGRVSQQSRALRRRLVLHMVVVWFVYTAFFVAAAFAVNALVVPRIAQAVVDQTATVVYTDDPEPYLERPGSWEVLPVRSSYASDELRVEETELYEVRELSTYLAVKQLKVPIAVLIYLAGCVAIVLWELQRALRSFDALAGAVATLIADRERPVELPVDLAIAQSELDRVRLAALADERAAAAAEQRKDELVAYLAHDIRTPLTSVIGYLSLLDEASDVPLEQRQRFTAAALAKAESLEGLIGELFEITRYNLRSIPIERQTVGARLLLEQVADELYPQARLREVSLSVEAPEGGTLFADAEKLARALSNVLRNAVSYADAGTEVRIEATEREAAWRICVTDRGREIAPEHLESIFEKFYREDAARSTDRGGSGLGLAIAREIVAAHGGTITAASEQGTTIFTIDLPQP